MEVSKMYKKLFLTAIATLSFSSIGNCDDDGGYGTVIPVEIRNNNEFIGHVGKLEYTGSSIDMSTFSGSNSHVDVLTDVCIITKKTIISKKVHNIECINQYGATSSGTIDFRKQFKGKITLVRQGGQLIINITADGKSWHKQNIPYIYLGPE
jgi:hypothetical protein